MAVCWVLTYDELLGGPPCAISFWPSSYDELVAGAPADDPVWPGCQWPDTYDELITGPVCQTVPIVVPEPEPIRCPTMWARLKTGGAWHVPPDERLEGVFAVPLMHDCDLDWGHEGDHVCLCAREYLKPGEEGVLTPPDETIDPMLPTGILPLGQLPTMLGGPVGALIQPKVVKDDMVEAQHILDNAGTE